MLRVGQKGENPMADRLKWIMKLVYAYLAVCGLVIFPCFILEESIQMATFGTWPAQDAKDWRLVVKGIDVIQRINTTVKIVNYSLGWIQPLSFFAYKAFSSATDYYVQALTAKVFAHAPEALDGHEITVTITLARAKVLDDRTYRFPRFILVIKSRHTGPEIVLTGKITIQNAIPTLEEI